MVSSGDSINLALTRTKQFAEMWAGCELKYCPHPASWFNAEGYNDDPAEWAVHATPSLATVMDLEKKVLRHPGNRESVYWKPESTPEQRQEYSALKQKLTSLKAKLAGRS